MSKRADHSCSMKVVPQTYILLLLAAAAGAGCLEIIGADDISLAGPTTSEAGGIGGQQGGAAGHAGTAAGGTAGANSGGTNQGGTVGTDAGTGGGNSGGTNQGGTAGIDGGTGGQPAGGTGAVAGTGGSAPQDSGPEVDTGPSVPPPPDSSPGFIEPCGVGQCSAGSQVCCLTAQAQDAGVECVEAGACDSIEAMECDEAADCPSGKVCCIDANYGLGWIATKCDAQPSCLGVESQSCRSDAECSNQLPGYQYCYGASCCGRTFGTCGVNPSLNEWCSCK